MFLLGFEGLLLAFGANLAAAKVAVDQMNEDAQNEAARSGGHGAPQSAPRYYQQHGGGVPYQENLRQHEEPQALAPEVHIQMADNGHFYAPIIINGKEDWAMIDTGATAVGLTREFAARIGVNLSKLRYDLGIRTGGVRRRAAKIVIPSIDVGSIVIRDVHGDIMEEDLPYSQNLIGMTFMSRLSEYTTRGDTLILRP